MRPLILTRGLLQRPWVGGNHELAVDVKGGDASHRDVVARAIEFLEMQEARFEEKWLPQVDFIDLDRAVFPVKSVEYERLAAVLKPEDHGGAGRHGNATGTQADDSPGRGSVNGNLPDVLHSYEYSAVGYG